MRCSYPGCNESTALGTSLCLTHYRRQNKDGTVAADDLDQAWPYSSGGEYPHLPEEAEPEE